jgi:class 3 adenylate cyclase/tetratricopeptide (TPR) repeat protein
MSVQSLTFGALLKRHRRAIRLTQEALAERAGYSPSYVSQLERGERLPTAATVELLAQALGLADDEGTALLAAARRGATPASPQPTQYAHGTDQQQGTAGDPADTDSVHVFLLANVRGYTRFTVEHGDEAAARLARRFATIARELVTAHKGNVIELRGDEALAVFASARQALQSAVALQARFAAATTADPALPLPVGIGLDAGEAVAVEGGYRGAALNLAARLCSLAGPGEVLASEGVVHLARRVAGLDYHDRGTVYLKGFADPERVLQVQSQSALVTAAAPVPLPSAEHSQPSDVEDMNVTPLPLGGFLGALPSGPLVARQQELDQILVAISAVEAGSGRLMLLTGEPGVGKTRLAQEVTLALRNRRFAIGVGRCYVPEQAVAYYPFRDALTLLHTLASADMRTQMPTRWPSLARLLSFQLSLPTTPASHETDSASSQEAQQRLFSEVAQALLALADHRPVAVLLDDLHWADSASLALLKYLARHTRAARVLLLGTYRDSEVPLQHPLRTALHELERERLVKQLAVRRLSQEGTTALVAASLGSGDVSPGLATLLHEHATGNPFFTQELLRGLIERGDIYRENDHWTRRAVADIVVPENVRSAIAERVWRLSEQAQEVLHEASVLGQTFTFDDLAGMSGRPEEALEAALEEARAAGVVRASERDGYAFHHVLIQQALYAELPPRRRRRLHQAVGEALERMSERTRERRVAELAYHFAQSSDREKALIYLMSAAARTRAAAAHHEEATLLDQAIEVAERLERSQLASELHALRGRALRALDQVEEAEYEFVAALNGIAADDVEQRIQILVALAEVWHLNPRRSFGRPYAEEALTLAQQVGRDDLVALAAAGMGLANTSDGNLLAGQERFQQAFALVDPGQIGQHVMAIDQYGLNLYYIGQLAEAAEHIQRVLDFGTRTHDTTYTPRALGNLLLVRAAQGRYADALHLYEAARQFAREHGAGRWIARAIAMWGGVHLEVADFAGAEALAEEARELARSVGFPPAVASTGLDLLFNYVRRHDVGHTEPLLDSVAEAVARAQGVHGWLWRLRFAQARAEIALARGDHEEALRCAEEAIAKSQATGRVKYQLAGLVTHGQALAALGRTKQGIADLRRAVELARGLGDPTVLLRAVAALLELDGNDALLSEARAAVQTIAAALPDEAMRRSFKVAEPARLVGRLTT